MKRAGWIRELEWGDALFVLGLGLLLVGLRMLSPALPWIAGGLGLIGFELLRTWRGRVG